MRVLPILPVLAAAAWTALTWDSLPDTWPSHWGPSGQVDGWGHPTLWHFALPLGVALGVAAFLELIAVYVARQAAERYRELSSAYADVVRLVSLAITTGVAGITLALPRGLPVVGVGILLASIFIAGLLGLLRVRIGARALESAGHTLPTGYNAFAYFNPDDDRLVVPKLFGIGQTFNFAHRRAWVLLAVILLPALAGFVAAMVTLAIRS